MTSKAVVDWFSRYGRFPSSAEPWTSGPSGTPATGNATLDEHVQPHHQRQHRTRSGVAPAATAQPGARLLQDCTQHLFPATAFRSAVWP